jgi:hypothetical protein
MDEEVRKVAADAVVQKAEALLAERADAVRQRAEADRRIRALDRALYDCRAAGRLFGVDIALPEDVRPGMIIPRSSSAMPRQTSLLDRLRAAGRSETEKPESQTPEPTPKTPDNLLSPPTVASTTLPAGAEPTIRDLILHYLRIAGAKGEKAAVLRRRVETFLNRQIHYKTIGMSLYRLSKETPPMVRREGQTWFLEQPSTESKDPDVPASGS